MFILSGLILEAREILFRDFWSLFSISFYFFSECNYLKKNKPTSGRTRAGHRPGPPFKCPPPDPPNPTTPAPSRARCRRRRQRSRRPRFAAAPISFPFFF